MAFSACLHTFCKKCIKKVGRVGCCPTCRAPTSEVRLNYALNDAVASQRDQIRRAAEVMVAVAADDALVDASSGIKQILESGEADALAELLRVERLWSSASDAMLQLSKNDPRAIVECRLVDELMQRYLLAGADRSEAQTLFGMQLFGNVLTGGNADDLAALVAVGFVRKIERMWYQDDDVNLKKLAVFYMQTLMTRLPEVHESFLETSGFAGSVIEIFVREQPDDQFLDYVTCVVAHLVLKDASNSALKVVSPDVVVERLVGLMAKGGRCADAATAALVHLAAHHVDILVTTNGVCVASAFVATIASPDASTVVRSRALIGIGNMLSHVSDDQVADVLMASLRGHNVYGPYNVHAPMLKLVEKLIDRLGSPPPAATTASTSTAATDELTKIIEALAKYSNDCDASSVAEKLLSNCSFCLLCQLALRYPASSVREAAQALVHQVVDHLREHKKNICDIKCGNAIKSIIAMVQYQHHYAQLLSLQQEQTRDAATVGYS